MITRRYNACAAQYSASFGLLPGMLLDDLVFRVTVLCQAHGQADGTEHTDKSDPIHTDQIHTQALKTRNENDAFYRHD